MSTVDMHSGKGIFSVILWYDKYLVSVIRGCLLGHNSAHLPKTLTMREWQWKMYSSLNK